jgi:hypothetical protein
MAFPRCPRNRTGVCMDNHISTSARYANSVDYQKTAANLLALIFLAVSMAIAVYLGAFP